jgi:hypothetical protein
MFGKKVGSCSRQSRVLVDDSFAENPSFRGLGDVSAKHFCRKTYANEQVPPLCLDYRAFPNLPLPLGEGRGEGPIRRLSPLTQPPARAKPAGPAAGCVARTKACPTLIIESFARDMAKRPGPWFYCAG